MKEFYNKYQHGRDLDFNKTNIVRALILLNKTVPQDDSILSYKDYLKQRDYLRFYQFNPKVFNSLVKIAYYVWHTDKRINRLNLIRTINAYLKRDESNYKIPEHINSMMFGLFKSILTTKKDSNRKGYEEELRNAVNSLVRTLKFGDDEIKWLCDNSKKSPKILNRVLRYNYKSRVITDWSKENFEKDFLRNRRAELIGRLLDFDAGYVVDKKILMDDSEYFIKLDKIAISRFEIYEKNKSKIKSLNKYPSCSYDEPELLFARRFYAYIPGFKEILDMIREEKADFNKLRDLFVEKLDLILKMTMIWGVRYSTLNRNEKVKLYKKYYDEGLNITLFHIGIKTEEAEIMKFLLEKKCIEEQAEKLKEENTIGRKDWMKRELEKVEKRKLEPVDYVSDDDAPF